ncbi:MAG TPA: DNA-directed RNA polymerase subunit alpha C-terminal domain-containing protein, partial [Armatimonadota bacterium]|nr:DNA-directed RNA polymerase subunit alpha C-terminal domain-containing protein [Armatimonadota bacterium]
MRVAASRLPGRLAQLTPAHLQAPVEDLGLGTRAYRCLRKLGTVEAVLQEREDLLLTRRNFGRASLADVRRRLALFALGRLGVPEGHPMRAACTESRPEVRAAWEAPAQPRPVAEVVDEILELLSRGEQLQPGRRKNGAR